MGLGSTRLRVRKRQKENFREVDELCVDIQNARGSNELRLNAVRRSAERHERVCKLHYKLLVIDEGFI